MESGLDLEKQIPTPVEAELFFLTSLFMELIDQPCAKAPTAARRSSHAERTTHSPRSSVLSLVLRLHDPSPSPHTHIG